MQSGGDEGTERSWGGSRPVPSASLKRGDAFNGPERFRSAHCAAFGRRRAEGFGRHPPAQTPIPPRPPRGLWSGSDLFAFRPDVGSLRRSVPPTPGIPRGGACRAVGWGGAVRGSVAVLGPPGTAPPPLPLCHTRSEEGAARSARTDAGPGKGPGSPIGPTVCVWGRAVWGGWRGGAAPGGHSRSGDGARVLGACR